MDSCRRPRPDDRERAGKRALNVGDRRSIRGGGGLVGLPRLVARSHGQMDVPNPRDVADREHVGQVLVGQLRLPPDHDPLIGVSIARLAEQSVEAVEVVDRLAHGDAPGFDDGQDQVVRGRRQRRRVGDFRDLHRELAFIPIIQPRRRHEEHQEAENHVHHRRHVDDRRFVGLKVLGEHRGSPDRRKAVRRPGFPATAARRSSWAEPAEEGRESPVAPHRLRRFAGNHVDHLPRLVVQLANQHVEPVEQIVVHRHRQDRDSQSERRGDEREADALRQRLAPRRPRPAPEGVERLNDPDDGSQQAEQRAERRHGAQDPHVPLQLDDLAGRVVSERLADRRPRLTPGLDDVGEDPRGRAVMGLAKLDRPVAVELAGRQPIEKPIDELGRDDPLPPQRREPFERESHRQHRANRQRPEHRVRRRQQPPERAPIDPRLRRGRRLSASPLRPRSTPSRRTLARWPAAVAALDRRSSSRPRP